MKPLFNQTAVKVFHQGGGLPRRATVSFTSVASARHAASRENCRIVGDEQRQAVPMSKRIEETDEVSRRNESIQLTRLTIVPVQSQIQVDKGEGPPEPDTLSFLCGSHSEPHIFALKHDASHELLEVEPNDTKTGRKRSRSDPGRDTPVAMETEAILSDDSKSETALEDALALGEELNPSVAMVEHEARAYPSIRGISETIRQDYRYPAPQVSADILHHEEMARRLSEANIMLAQWHTWAVRNGLPVPPHSGFPPVYSTVQQPQFNVSDVLRDLRVSLAQTFLIGSRFTDDITWLLLSKARTLTCSTLTSSGKMKPTINAKGLRYHLKRFLSPKGISTLPAVSIHSSDNRLTHTKSRSLRSTLRRRLPRILQVYNIPTR